MKKRPEDLDTHYTMSENDRNALQASLLELSANPYVDYRKFREEIIDLTKNPGKIPSGFSDNVLAKKERDCTEQPFVVFENMPLDPKASNWHWNGATPVEDKRNRKTTFVSERLLSLYAYLSGEEPIAYKNVNDGDVHQDIYPRKGEERHQSQKALEEIWYHKDLANHFLRPDTVNILGIRNDSRQVITTCVRNIDILRHFSETEIDILRAERFTTPFDDLTKQGAATRGDRDRLSEDVRPHPILRDQNDINFFEGRTQVIDPRDFEANKLISEIITILHRVERAVHIGPGTLLGTANNEAIHSRQFFGEPDHRHKLSRWLQKTVNVHKNRFPLAVSIRHNGKVTDDRHPPRQEGYEWIVNG